jgi:hypothetical protein
MLIHCQRCDNQFLGRANRQYCSTACKSAVNNERQLVKTKELIDTNKILRRNRRILIELFELFGSQPFDRSLLDRKGFNSDLVTSAEDDRILVYEFTLYQKSKSSFFINKN